MRGTKTVVLNEKKGEKMKTKTQTRCAAGLEYTLEIKAVKRLNLRLRRDGSIALSVPPGTPAAVADDFVQRKADWLRTARQRVLAREQALQRRQPPTRGECAAVFARADAKIWPLFRQALGGRKPDIRMRPMETRWGVCSPAQYRITLSTWLALEPMEAVVLGSGREPDARLEAAPADAAPYRRRAVKFYLKERRADGESGPAVVQ